MARANKQTSNEVSAIAAKYVRMKNGTLCRLFGTQWTTEEEETAGLAAFRDPPMTSEWKTIEPRMR